MNVENTKKLLTAYPLLYRKLREWGFECGDGWFDLVWQLSGEIEVAARHEGIPESSDTWPSVGVVKYKLGDLRVQFVAPVSDNIRDLVDKARDISVNICELCAAPCNKAPETEQVNKYAGPLCDDCRKANRSP